MHHCLSIAEIMRQICDQIHNEQDPNTRDLLNLALTSRDWSVVALDCLWERIFGVDCLIRCMPDSEGLWCFARLEFEDLSEFRGSEKQIILKKMPTSSELDVLNKYTPRIRSFTYGDDIVVPPYIYGALSRACCSFALLPNLQILNWVGACKPKSATQGECFPYVHLFLGPRLETLQIEVDIANPEHRRILKKIPTELSRNISHLELAFSEEGSGASLSAIHRISADLHEWRHLSRLTVDDVTFSGLFTLATLPKLEELKLSNACYLWELPRSTADGRTKLLTKLRCFANPFPSLKSIVIENFDDSEPLLLITNFFTILRNAKITDISLFICVPYGPGGLQDLFEAIADHCCHASLKSFKLQLGFVSHLPFSTIRPLLYFFALQSVFVDAHRLHYGITISEDDMSQLVSSWPDIRRLWLGPCAKQPSNTTLLALLPLTRSLKLRHLGLSLDASLAAVQEELRENFPDYYKGSRNYSLRTLEVGGSPISQKEFVAKFLSEIFANLDDIAASCQSDPPTSDSRRWCYISQILLPLLSDVRRRERELLGVHELRGTALRNTSRWSFEKAEKSDSDWSGLDSTGCRPYKFDWED